MSEAERLWPTPRAGKITEENEAAWSARRDRGDVATPPLALAVKLWKTPTASDARTGPADTQRHASLAASVNRASGSRPSATGKLSAAWVSRMMGFPDGWLDVA